MRSPPVSLSPSVSELPRGRAARLLVGCACVGLGGYLIAAPFSALGVLVAVVGASLLVSGVAELLEARRRGTTAIVAGVAALLAGVLALSWPGITLLGIALATGVSLLVGGLARGFAAARERGEERLLLAAGAVSAIVAGILALAWPGATVLVVALIVGMRTALFGLVTLVAALRPAPRGSVLEKLALGRRLRWLLTLAGLALALGGLGVSIALHAAGDVRPGPFYTPPVPLPRGSHGSLIRSELLPGVYQGAKTYRVLYKSVGFDGRATAVSGLVIVPEGPVPRGGRKVIAFAHGTVGVARSCAPSLHPSALTQVIEGLGQFLADGYVVAATDYSGLGTPGPHPYLVGRVEGVDVLDSVRAARQLAAAHAGAQFAIWGHSQGGQAALFAAQLAAGYTPELHLAGVAAGAPVPEPIDLFKVNVATTVGRVLIAMALSAWSQLYPGAALGQVVTPTAQGAIASVARYCLYGKQALATIPGAALLGVSFVKRAPWEVQPWRRIMEANTPAQATIRAPVLLVQGGADTIVPSRLTVALARHMCAAGEVVDLSVYPTDGHLETGIVASPDVGAWVAARFAGKPPPSTCR